MGKRKHLIFPCLVLMTCMPGTLKAAEKNDDSLTSDKETTSNTTLEQEESNEEKQDVNTVKTQDKTTTIKMIVGGESSDGVAKQVILPVKE
jgi:hypothetical protein